MDHLPLPPGQPLTSRRARGNPIPERVVRRIQHGAELTERLDDLASQVPADIAEAEEDDARLVLKIRAATRLSNGPFARLRFTPLGEGEDWTYYVLSSRESRELLASVLADYAGLPDGKSKDVNWDHPKSWAEFLDHIDGIELYGADDRADPTLAELVFDPVDTIDCLLWPAGNDQIATGRVNSIIAGISDHAVSEPRVHVVAIDPRPDRTLVRVVATEALVGELLNNVDVERIRAPLRAVITQSALTTASMPDDVPEPAKTVIGVVDGVINIANPLTGPFVVDAEDFRRDTCSAEQMNTAQRWPGPQSGETLTS